MFEIEKNFDADKEKVEKFLEGAMFIGQKIFTDVYYDNENYGLTKKDIWLRARDGKFELKIAIDGGGDSYEEIDDENKIREYFKYKGSIKELLEKNNYLPFCICKTTRKKYKKDGFSIDIDFAEFNEGFTFKALEIELMVEDQLKAAEAARRITEFARQHGLQEVYKGKITEYLRNKRPDHFKVLVNAGIAWE